MRFTTKKAVAYILIAAMSVSFIPGNAGMSAKHAGAAGAKPSAVKQDAARKAAAEADPAATKEPAVEFSKGSGTYGEAFDLKLNYTDANAAIYYTTDGSDPSDPDNENRLLYADGIAVKDRKKDSNVLAAIDPILFDSVNVKVSKDGKSFESTIKPPSNEAVDKCTVIKAVAQLADGTCSKVATNTYFIGEMADHIEGIRESVEAAGMDLSVMSISMDAEDLFDSTKGIYVKGDTFDKALEEYLNEHGEINSWDTETCRDLDANYKQKGREWERNTHIDYFESNGTNTTCELQQDCGIRIQGNYSRSDYQKSFRLYARNEYGKKNFKYGFWDSAKDDAGNTIEKYKKITLRNGGNCAFTTKFSDSYWQSLIQDIDCDKQSARPCAVYLNGEYWGIYVLQDDFCGAYMENKHGIDKDNILIYKGDAEAIPELGYKLDEGDLPAGVTDESYYFHDLEEFMRQHDDLSKEEDFNAFCELVDKDSALDYFAMQVWINNKWDWPGKNWSMWRCTDAAKDPSNPYADGKWRFLIYDVEFGGVSGSGDARSNTVKESKLLTTGTADEGSPNRDKPNVRCFALLMTNKGFRDAFNERVESFSEGMFEQEHALAEAERYGKMYEPILGQFFDRFPTTNSVDNAINGGYASLRCITDFLEKRADYIPTITKWVRKQFGDPEPDPSPAPTVSPGAAPQNTAKPSASPTPARTDEGGTPLPPDQRDLEIPLGDGSVKILHVNYVGTKVEYTAYRVEGVTYRLKSDGSFSYMAKNAEKLKKKKSVVIADVAVAGGKRYKVTEIEAGALQGLKKLQKVTIGENVKTIGKNAFKNCKKLKQLVISGSKLKKIGKNALKGTAKKLKISCPKKKKKAYQKLVKKSGVKAKAMQVKALSFKQSQGLAAESSSNKAAKTKNAGQLKNNAAKKTAANAEKTITMSSLKKADGSYTNAEIGSVVTIGTAEELKMLSEYTRAKNRTADVTFRQIADIDGTDMVMHGIGETTYALESDEDGYEWWGTGEEKFFGTYDGGGKQISNLNIAVPKTDDAAVTPDTDNYPRYYLALFSHADNATVQNVDLRSIRFVDEKSGEDFEAEQDTDVYAAGIVAYAEDDTVISGCSNYADITVSGESAYAAGICNFADESAIKNCHNYGKITADCRNYESGISIAAGVARYADLSSGGCSNAGTVSAFGGNSAAYGVFYSNYGEVSDCTNTGTVTAEGIAAGIIGNSNEQVKRCVNSGDVSAKNAAGIVYNADYSSIFDCSNSGKVNGTRMAGGIGVYAERAKFLAVSNAGEVTAGQWAGGIIASALRSTIANAENSAAVSSQNAAGGAVGIALESGFVNVWNHGALSAPVSVGGIVGTADEKEFIGDDDDHYDLTDEDTGELEACKFANCIHLGILTGEEHKGTVIAHSNRKDELKYCYCSEGSTDSAHGSDSSITAKKVAAEAWKQEDFIQELNQNLSDISIGYAIPVKYDAERGIQWVPAVVFEFYIYSSSSTWSSQEIGVDLPIQLRDTAEEEYVNLSVKDNSCIAEVSPGKTYELYYLAADGSRKLIEADISLEAGESMDILSIYLNAFCAYTDAKGEVREWDASIEVQERTLYYQQYYQDESEVSLPPENPVKEGYDFAGWYSSPSACNEELYAALKAKEIELFQKEYEGYIEEWNDYLWQWYDGEYSSAEEFATASMGGYASVEEFEKNYDKYYEEEYAVKELFIEDEWDGELYLRADMLYARWIKKETKPAATSTPAPGTAQATPKPEISTGAYYVRNNLQQYKAKLGNYVQKKGVIYQVNPKKKTAAVVGVSSKMLTSVTVQPTVKTDGKTYKVTAINKKAFTGCKQLKTLRIKGKNLKKVDKKALQGAAKKVKISASAKIKKLF